MQQPESLANHSPFGQSLFPNVTDSASWNKRQVLLRFLTFILSIVGFATAIALVFAPVVLTLQSLDLGFTTACILWNSFELYVIYVRKDKSELQRPKTRIAIELALSICGVASTVVQTVYVLREEDNPTLQEGSKRIWVGMSRCLCALLAIISIIHITLFVRKCIEYNARKKQVLVDTLVQELSRRNQETQEQTVHTVSPISPASYKEYPRKAEEMLANWDKPVELSAMNTNVYEMDASPPCPKELA
ncbi:hypothetical protein BJ166DRAFT_513483 [Pestalotiopsis sp. NC0098]|nr:hypothetical protein BJ166DRAFT_513483 [Pestalotiopsis sp. NC0098]